MWFCSKFKNRDWGWVNINCVVSTYSQIYLNKTLCTLWRDGILNSRVLRTLVDAWLGFQVNFLALVTTPTCCNKLTIRIWTIIQTICCYFGYLNNLMKLSSKTNLLSKISKLPKQVIISLICTICINKSSSILNNQ